MRESDIDKAFTRTMLWVVISMLIILGIAGLSHLIHKGDETSNKDRESELVTLEDSIHYYEDGM